MILLGPVRLAIVAAMALMAAPASADVLEIGDEGARWIAGPQSSAQLSDTSGIPAPPVELGAGYLIPAGAIGNAASHSANIPPQYAATVHELAARFDLSPSLIEALVWQESRWQPNALSPVGARGLAQLMPGTAREMGVDPDDPFANLEGGARYLRQQLDRFDGDLEKALAAYNAGPGRVLRANGIPRIRETQNYVVSIIGRLANHSRSTE